MSKADEKAAEIMRLMSEEGLSQREAGARMGMSEPSTSKCLARFRKRTAAAITLSKPVSDVVRRQLDELSSLVRLADDARELISLIQTVLKASEWREQTDAKARLRRVCEGSPDKFLLGLMAEERKQVELHFNMREKYCTMERVAEFQRVVMEEIQKESPETAQRIVARLVQTRTLRDSIDLGMPQPAAGV